MFICILLGINANVAIEDIDVSIERDLPRSMSLEPHKNRCEMLRLAINKNKLVRPFFRVCNRTFADYHIFPDKYSLKTEFDGSE